MTQTDNDMWLIVVMPKVQALSQPIMFVIVSIIVSLCHYYFNRFLLELYV